jgi:hypothetical protein
MCLILEIWMLKVMTNSEKHRFLYTKIASIKVIRWYICVILVPYLEFLTKCNIPVFSMAEITTGCWSFYVDYRENCHSIWYLLFMISIGGRFFRSLTWRETQNCNECYKHYTLSMNKKKYMHKWNYFMHLSDIYMETQEYGILSIKLYKCTYFCPTKPQKQEFSYI